MKHTANLNLKKPDYTDLADIQDINDNMDKIDTELGVIKSLVTTTGSANAYVAAIPGIANLVAGLRVTIKINVANTSASTLNINSLGLKSIVKAGGTALSSGNLKAGGVYTLVYDGTNFQLQGEGASGNAIASDLLLGKTATVDAGEIIGTLIPGKKWATGTFPARTVQGVSDYTNIVTGLDFTPAVIIVNNSRPMVRNYNGGTNIEGLSGSIRIVFNTRAFGTFQVIYLNTQSGSQFIAEQTWFACD